VVNSSSFGFTQFSKSGASITLTLTCLTSRSRPLAPATTRASRRGASLSTSRRGTPPACETSSAMLMGTPANKALLVESRLGGPEAGMDGPNDLIVALAARDPSIAESALAKATALLMDRRPATAAGPEYVAPQTIAEALSEAPDANLAIVSTPGAYATAEALQSLKRGLHVFLFSDNVPITDEIEMKRLAVRKGLLMMGPDCGTSVLDGVPLGFANELGRGRIGLIGASGTGLQEVSCLIDRMGEGVSQVIGVGGRDLDEHIGGMMLLAAFGLLSADPATDVIVLISKPPSPAVAQRIVEAASSSPKPVVVNFLGGDPTAVRAGGAMPATTLEDAAVAAVALCRGVRTGDLPTGEPEASSVETAQLQAMRLAPRQRSIRRLYSGGTFCKEARLILEQKLGPERMTDHVLIDLGDDEYTVGRPHPVIDFRLRNEKIVAAAQDPATGVILLDVVLGHGANPDPAEALLPALERARREAAGQGRHLVIIASVCGTAADPQDLHRQEATLETVGVLLASSNGQAARLASVVIEQMSAASGPFGRRAAQ